MSIDSLRSGAIRICFDSSLNVFPSKCRILLEGQMLDTGTAPDGELIKIPALRDVDLLFGEGSVIANSLRVAFGCCPDNAMEFYALPHKDSSVGAVAKAVYELEFQENAETSGRIDLFIGDGRWNSSTYIQEGTKDDQIAVAVANSLQQVPGFPFDVLFGDAALGQGNIVTLTAKNAGTVGNGLNVIYNWHQRRDYAPVGPTMEFRQPNNGTNQDFTVPNYPAILGECCYCCIAMLYDNRAWQKGMIDYIASAWSCDKPQCFGHGYTYNMGSFGEILAADTNSAEVSRLAQCTGDPILGYLKTAAYAAQSCCSTIDNPELSIQGPNFGVLPCVKMPESCFQCFTFEEQQVLQASGFVVTTPLAGGTGALTSPMVVNDTTNNRFDADGKLNATWWNVSSRRLAAATADAAAIALSNVIGLGLFTKNTTIPRGIRGTNPRLILGQFRAWAKSEVGRLFSEFDNIDKDIILQTDFEKAPRCQGVPGKMWLNFVYRPPVRVTSILINAQPSLLSNC